MLVKKMLPAAACLLFASAANAAFVIVDNLGGPVIMQAGTLPVLTPGSLTLTEPEMQSVHAALNLDGVDTDGYVTFVLAQTNAGLSFFSLIDSNNVGGAAGGATLSQLGMSTSGPSSLDRYVNAEAGDQTNWINNFGTQTFSALYSWNGANEADGFAWGNLSDGDAVTYHFTNLGAPALDPNAPMQFVSYQQGSWQVVADADFTTANQFVFSFSTVPSPGALALLGLAGIVGASRRRIA